MGLKSGSRESGIDEEDGKNENQDSEDEEVETQSRSETQTDSVFEGDETAKETTERNKVNKSSEQSVSGMSGESSKIGETNNEGGPRFAGDEESMDADEQPEEGRDTDTVEGNDEETKQFSVDSLPYKLRRQNVNEGRVQVPYFLRPEVTEGEKELKRSLEDDLGETVYKSDYREAAMIVAQRNPELIAEVLREWGYDLTE